MLQSTKNASEILKAGGARYQRLGAGPPSGGRTREVLDIVRFEPHSLIVSPYLLGEVWRVLHYPRLQALHQLTEHDMETFVVSLAEAATVVYLPEGDRVAVSRDADDDAIVQTAVAGQADVLCTRDRHLRELSVTSYCSERGITVMDELELLKLRREML